MSLKHAIFELFDFKNAVTSKTGLGSVKVIGMSPCDRAHTTSYSCSIVTKALSRIVSEIFNVEKNVVTLKSGHRSLKVIESSSIR